MFVRVDGLNVHIKETRLFHAFDADGATADGTIRVHVVVTWKELDLGPTPTSVPEEKVSSGTKSSAISATTTWRPGNVGTMPYNSSDTDIQHLLRMPQELSEKLPVVNDKYRIPQFYTLTLHVN
jgi:hypothetical protein